MDLSIVVPVYNEEESIPKLYQALVPVLVRLKKSSEIVFVDDGSNDNSFKILSGLAQKDKSIKVIKFARNFGQTAALLAGFKNSAGKVIVTMDADLQNRPEDIPKLLDKLNQGYDVVCGWRAERKDKLGKKLASKFSNFLRRRLIKLDIHDSGCTLRAYKRKTIENLNIYGEHHRYIPAIISSMGFKVAEEKIQHQERKYGRTKYGVTRLPKGFLDLLTLKFLTSYESRPIHVFGSIGILLFVLGFIGGIYLLYEKFYLNLAIAGRPLIILVILLLILGIQFILNGFIAELVVRTKQTQSYKIEKVVKR